MAHLLISAAHKSSGKTTLTIGLCAALRQRGHVVQPFKKGPDYIDPLWLGRAAGRACRNLDFNTQCQGEISAMFARFMQGADIGIIEGNKGLYDGVALDGGDANAALARLLLAPIVLVIDTQGMTRGIAPLLRGYQDFEPGLEIAGVILNKVAGHRHEGKLRAVVEHYTGLPVLGAVPRRRELEIDERHLGLVPSNEAANAAGRIDGVAALVAAEVDLDKILAIAGTAPPVATPAATVPPPPPPDLRIGYLCDAAFHFYYPDDLDALAEAGAELVAIDSLKDRHLPAIDGLFLGGGFPETNMRALVQNTSLLGEIRTAIDKGLPSYAECGGLMLLARRIIWNGESAAMAGVLDADAVMYRKPQGRGLVELRETAHHPWPQETGPDPAPLIAAHEFHYSRLENIGFAPRFAYEVRRGFGLDGKHDGIVYKNLLASYAHMRTVNGNDWAGRFAAFVRAITSGGSGNLGKTPAI
jgi:cobyrinic acid a,c-diamide synthase